MLEYIGSLAYAAIAFVFVLHVTSNLRGTVFQNSARTGRDRVGSSTKLQVIVSNSSTSNKASEPRISCLD